MSARETFEPLPWRQRFAILLLRSSATRRGETIALCCPVILALPRNSADAGARRYSLEQLVIQRSMTGTRVQHSGSGAAAAYSSRDTAIIIKIKPRRSAGRHARSHLISGSCVRKRSSPMYALAIAPGMIKEATCGLLPLRLKVLISSHT